MVKKNTQVKKVSSKKGGIVTDSYLEEPVSQARANRAAACRKSFGTKITRSKGDGRYVSMDPFATKAPLGNYSVFNMIKMVKYLLTDQIENLSPNDAKKLELIKSYVSLLNELARARLMLNMKKECTDPRHMWMMHHGKK